MIEALIVYAKKSKLSIKLNIDYVVNDDNTYSYIVKSLECSRSSRTPIVYSINFEGIEKTITILPYERVAIVDISTVSTHSPEELIYDITYENDDVIHDFEDDNINEVDYLTKEEAETLYIKKIELNDIRGIIWGVLDKPLGALFNANFVDIFITKEEIYNTYLTKEEFKYFLENYTKITWGIIPEKLNNNYNTVNKVDDYFNFITREEADEIFVSKNEFDEMTKLIDNGIQWGIL